jgi:zinc D-Ala-D-Ala carboxypeptidase
MLIFKYFKYEEFDDAPGTGRNMDNGFLLKLEEARIRAKIPFIITSGWRSKETNERVGGSENSSHLKGLAADIKCTNSADRLTIVKSLIDSGFKRIGISDKGNFIHVDLDESKAPALWLY